MDRIVLNDEIRCAQKVNGSRIGRGKSRMVGRVIRRADMNVHWTDGQILDRDVARIRCVYCNAHDRVCVGAAGTERRRAPIACALNNPCATAIHYDVGCAIQNQGAAGRQCGHRDLSVRCRIEQNGDGLSTGPIAMRRYCA